MIALPHQPLAQRILRAALARAHPPQQLLLAGPPGTGKEQAAREVAWALMDPRRERPRTTEALDLTELTALGAQILSADLERALAQVSAEPQVMDRRVLIIHAAERLTPNDGAHRILKTLEEPPPRSHILLVTDHPARLLPTVHSRCLPVPFRPPGWRAIAAELETQGEEPGVAADRARAEGPLAVTASPFERRIRSLGVEFALAALSGGGNPAALIATLQQGMDEAAAASPSDELQRLRAEAATLEGKRGGRTAAKRAEDQEKRERRRLVTDGWTLVLDTAAGVMADGLALSLGAEGAVRHRGHLETLRPLATAAQHDLLVHAIEQVDATRGELPLNPRIDLQAEALLTRIDLARRGHPHALSAPGRLRI